MKNKTILLVMLALIVSAAVFTGCKTTEASIVSLHDGDDFGRITKFPVKDFSSLGLVFTEATLKTTSDSKNSTAEGEAFIYQKLLQEAKKLNADTIINVVIDTRTLSQGTVTRFFGIPVKREGLQEITFYGSALAIKYGNALTTGSTTTTTVGETTTTATTTSPVFDSGISASITGKAPNFIQRIFGKK